MRSSSEKTRDFGMAVERLVVDSDLTYMDAIVHLMDKQGLDEDTVSKLVKKNPVIKIKLEMECESLNLLNVETQNTLPL